MGKYSRLAGGAAPYALLLGALALPNTAVSESAAAPQASTNDNAGVTAPVQQPIPQGKEAYRQGMGHHGMTPPGWGGNDSTYRPGFAGHMPPPGRHYGPDYGSGGYGPNADMPQRQLSQGYAAGNQNMAAGSSMQAPPMFGMGASPFPSPSYGTMEPGQPANLPQADQEGGFSSGSAFPGYAHNPFMGHSCGMGTGHGCGMGMKHGGGMRVGANIWQLFQMPGLSDEQREKIYDILDKLRRNHWNLMGEKMDQSAQLRRLYRAEKPDAKAIGAVYGKICDGKRKMIEAKIEANQKAMDVLTEEQRKQLPPQQHWGM
uniref:Protein refolding chaperone Spy/CpxP family n=1 Tax=Candidatus Kentrum sp. FW TaxID=2126338 RepID=A0A450THG4_9GAMM|nr:MAG: protein refolding chaperone Spy/CpxP family [Candidatus Kentron sp. FW]